MVTVIAEKIVENHGWSGHYWSGLGKTYFNHETSFRAVLAIRGVNLGFCPSFKSELELYVLSHLCALCMK